ncbi:MAG: efflux RND transporter permease subunit, partial [Rikenellaceae bacterium]
TITVEFTEESQQTSFPSLLKSMVISQALLIGGADWGAYGIDDRGFSNSLDLDRKSSRISLSGYNYDRLYKYAENLCEKIKSNKRVSDVDVEMGGDLFYGGGNDQINEMYIKYDAQKVALYNVNLNQTYGALSELLSSGGIGTYRNGSNSTNMVLLSSQRDKFDLWNLFNSYIKVGDSQVRYSQIGEISKRKAKSSIPKRNQEYTLDVAFNFMGSYELSDRFIKKTIEETNAALPIGFRCENSSSGWYDDTGSQYWLLILIVVIIFFMCSFESLRQPLVIISLIPLSFIGVFLTFYFSGLNFGTGGFASMVLLSGLVVNAAIYIINEYNNYRKIAGDKSLISTYVKSFNHKIIPVLLTVLSTVLGLIPFLMDGPKEQFWFSFAVGTSGGLLFSIVALVFILPILMNFKK